MHHGRVAGANEGGRGAMGAHYRHTTPEMAGRVADAIQQRLTVVLDVAERALQISQNRATLKVV
jgi:hypothetical protein